MEMYSPDHGADCGNNCRAGRAIMFAHDPPKAKIAVPFAAHAMPRATSAAKIRRLAVLR